MINTKRETIQNTDNAQCIEFMHAVVSVVTETTLGTADTADTEISVDDVQ